MGALKLSYYENNISVNGSDYSLLKVVAKDGVIITQSSNYYTFGSPMPGRSYQSSTDYRYGFNGKENDNETVGTGEGTQDYGMRIYNPALGKFLSVDPLTKQYPWYTPYQFAGNNPIMFLDLDGAEELDSKKYAEGMINGAAKLNNAPFPHDIGGGHWRFTIDGNNAFFTTDGYAFILKPGVKPGDGVKDILAHPEKYAMDCGTYSQITKLSGMLNSMGDDAFNAFYKVDKNGNYDFKIKNQQSSGLQFAILYINQGGGQVMGSNSTKLFSADKIITKSDIGTEITLTTPALAKTAYYNENIVKVGKDQYVAQGLGKDPMTMDQIKSALSQKAGIEKTEVIVSQIRTPQAVIK